MGELHEGDNARILASPMLENLMAKISSLEIAVAQRGTSAPELRFLNQNRGWGKRACVHGFADGFKKDSVGNPSSKQAFSCQLAGDERFDVRQAEVRASGSVQETGSEGSV